MNLFHRSVLALSLAGATVLAGCASSPASNHLTTADVVMRGASPTAAVALAVNPPQVRVGDTIGLQLGSAKAGYLYVYQVGTDGTTLSMVFPNAVDGANYLPGGGAAASLPRANWRLTSKGPAGVGYFLAVVADKPQDLGKVASELAAGRISIDGPYGAAMATLREVAP
jgi:hypothetical protein